MPIRPHPMVVASGALASAAVIVLAALLAARSATALPTSPSAAVAAARGQVVRPSVFLPLALAGIALDELPLPGTSPAPEATRTPWVPATTAADCDTPTPPGATATAFPTVTPRSPARNEPPPELRLITASEIVTGMIGTYCWGGVCADKFAIVTSAEPLIVRSPLSAHMVLAVHAPPTSITMSVYDVAGLEPDGRFTGLWAWKNLRRGSSYRLAGRQDNAITIARSPGLYVVSVGAYWRGDDVDEPRGDVFYTFLVAVQP